MRLKEKTFRKKFNQNQKMMNLEKKERKMENDAENKIFKNYKR